MYLVVVFTDTSSSAFIPINWVDPEGRQCALWPPYKDAKRIDRAVCSKREPEPNWRSFLYRELSRTDSYEKARVLLQRSLYTSDLATADELEEESTGKRQRRPAPSKDYPYSDSSLSDLNGGDQSPLQESPSAQSPSGASGGLAPSGSNSQSYNHSPRTSTPCLQSRRILHSGDTSLQRRPGGPASRLFDKSSYARASIFQSRPFPRDDPFEREFRVPTSPNRSGRSLGVLDQQELQRPGGCATCDGTIARLDAKMERLFFILEKQNEELADLKKMVAQASRGQLARAVRPLPEGVKFPLETVEEVHELERHLLDEEKDSSVLHELSVVGGNTLKECTYQLLKFLFSTGLAVRYCWGGSDGRLPFSTLRLKDVLMRAVRKNPRCRDASNVDIKYCVQEWFRSAPDRNGRRRRRQEHAADAGQ